MWSSSARLGIIAAVHQEVSEVLKDPRYKWQKKGNHLFVAEKNLSLVLTGVGKANAAFHLASILDGCAEILILGTAGGLQTQPIGSLFLVSEFVEYDMDVSALGIPQGVTPYSVMQDFLISCPSPLLSAAIRTACRDLKIELFEGRIMSGDRFVYDSSALKSEIAEFRADLVDMESAAIAKMCLFSGKPVTALRYITDNADHNALKSWAENVKKSSVLFARLLKKIIGL